MTEKGRFWTVKRQILLAVLLFLVAGPLEVFGGQPWKQVGAAMTAVAAIVTIVALGRHYSLPERRRRRRSRRDPWDTGWRNQGPEA
jgi:hypothetical protein